jgi:hypothetical protein
MNMPGFIAEASLYRTSEHYKLTRSWDGSAGKQTIIPQWYCCIMRPPEPYGAIVVGCRGHNAWYPFAWAACVAEAASGQLNATLVEGTCSARPECQGKIL